MAKRSKHNIIIPVGMKPRPKIHEETAADVLANHFESDVHFIETAGQGTPDVSIKGINGRPKAPSVVVRTISERTCVRQVFSPAIL